MNKTELTLQISDTTIKKLRAIAVLTGTTVDQLEGEISKIFDQMLTKNLSEIVNSFAIEEGILSEPAHTSGISASFGNYQSKENNQEDPDKEMTYAEEDNSTEHSLSSEDIDQTPSEDQKKDQAPKKEEDSFAFTIDAAEGDEEDFITAAIEVEKTYKKLQDKPPTNISAAQSFNPKKRQAHIAEYTGEESGSFF